MELVLSLNSNLLRKQRFFCPSRISPTIINSPNFCFPTNQRQRRRQWDYSSRIVNSSEKEKDSIHSSSEDEEVDDLGVKAALSMLRFYKREISPLLPKSCRFVPTCSEYSMIAYQKYGFAKGTILTVWRICRCNPLVLRTDR